MSAASKKGVNGDSSFRLLRCFEYGLPPQPAIVRTSSTGMKDRC